MKRVRTLFDLGFEKKNASSKSTENIDEASNDEENQPATDKNGTSLDRSPGSEEMNWSWNDDEMWYDVMIRQKKSDVMKKGERKWGGRVYSG